MTENILERDLAELIFLEAWLGIYQDIYQEKKEGDFMLTAKIFENGRSQAVRLPKECRFSSDEVLVNKIGDIVILLPKSSNWDSFAAAIDMFSDDFMDDKRDDSLQEREILWDICLIPTYVYIYNKEQAKKGYYGIKKA